MILPQLENNGAFVYGFTGVKDKPYIDFNGMIKLYTDSLTIELDDNVEKFRKKLAKSICSTENIMLGSYSCSSRDSSIIEILCEKDISNKISPEYSIIEPYTDSVSFPILVYNIDSLSLQNLLLENNIKNAEIENLNK
jgi:hypothetical protein